MRELVPLMVRIPETLPPESALLPSPPAGWLPHFRDVCIVSSPPCLPLMRALCCSRCASSPSITSSHGATWKQQATTTTNRAIFDHFRQASGSGAASALLMHPVFPPPGAISAPSGPYLVQAPPKPPGGPWVALCFSKEEKGETYGRNLRYTAGKGRSRNLKKIRQPRVRL